MRNLRRLFSSSVYIWENTMTSTSAKPTLLKSPDLDIVKMVSSDSHFAAVAADGHLYTWGQNADGQLGLGDLKPRFEPTMVAALKKAVIRDVVVGEKHTIALDDQGRVYSWGRGTFSDRFRRFFMSSCLALGHKESKNLWLPKQIEGLKDVRVVQVSTGNQSAMALDDKHRLWNWGRHEFGTSGMGNKEAPEPVLNFVVEQITLEKKSHLKKIDSCSDFQAIMFENKELYFFGNNDQSLMGLGPPSGFDTSDVVNFPTQIKNEDKTLARFEDFTLGESTGVFIDAAGDIFVTGQKRYHFPTKFPRNFAGEKLRCFAASDRGVGVLTDDNRLFALGNFWCKGAAKKLGEGVVEVDVKTNFDDKKLKLVGGRYGTRFAVAEN